MGSSRLSDLSFPTCVQNPSTNTPVPNWLLLGFLVGKVDWEKLKGSRVGAAIPLLSTISSWGQTEKWHLQAWFSVPHSSVIAPDIPFDWSTLTINLNTCINHFAVRKESDKHTV